MSFFSYKKIDVTRKCSAQCSHCHEYHEDSDSWEVLDEFKFQHEIERAPAATVFLLSGGEPFEAPTRLRAMIKILERQALYFRIATGLHVPLEPSFCDVLRSEFLVGISVGTDVIHPKRNQRSDLKKNWEQNLAHIRQQKIPYSFTVSVLEGEQIDILSHLNAYQSPELGPAPSFFMLIGQHQDIHPLFVDDEKVIKCAL